MTQESPYYPKSKYQQHKISEENGLVEHFIDDHDPEYLLERGEKMKTTQLNLDFFLYQSSLEDFSYK